jgi:hypothetical protein
MNIEQLFKKDITRDIQGVIKIGQQDKAVMKKELEEYVVTDELKGHFETFYTAYNKAYGQPTDRVGVWISGFFGSGKSHFLKILSYLLQSDLEADGKRPVDFFKEKVNGQELHKQMENSTRYPSEVVLFNIDSKADSDSKQNKTAIVKVFNKVFNEMRGYSASIPWLAELEETLDKKGQYEDFKAYFEEETGMDWQTERESIFYHFDETVTALAKAMDSSEESAERWLDNGEKSYSISVERFAERIKEYVSTKEDNYRLIFSVDEVGQYIADNTELMLNLQTVVEDLGKYCHGKVWVLVTSQQDINSLSEEMSSTDFSKIQGRFNTRVSLSSANADEVIKIRLLEKKAEAHSKLISIYTENEIVLKNKLEFEDAAAMRFYQNSDDFSKVYPFVPYQFNLLQKVFTGIREHGSAGKHLSDGERNLLESIQQATIMYKDQDLNTLVPFYVFYDNIEQALEHSVRSTIIKADQNDSIGDFDVAVLKLLFLVRYVDEMPGTIKNLTTLMISSIDEDLIALNKKIKRSLDLLEDEFLIQRIGNKYLFLTNEEQDINREIENISIPTSEYVMDAGRRLSNEVLDLKKFDYKPFADRPDVSYLMDLSQWIDDRPIKNASTSLGVRFITSYSEYYDDSAILALSQRESDKIIVRLPEEETFKEIKQWMKINQYLRNQSTQSLTPVQDSIRSRKAAERSQLEKVSLIRLKEAVNEADIIVNGSVVQTSGSPEQRISQGLQTLVSTIYPKLMYIEKNYDRHELERLCTNQNISMLEDYEDENGEATQEIESYLNMQNELNKTITLLELVQRFTIEPYGWKELDILASLIRMIKLEKVQFTLNSRKLTPDDTAFVRDVTRKATQEKILVIKRETLDPSFIKKVKTVSNELFGITSIGDKEDEMAAILSDKLSTKEKELSILLSHYREAHYPDRQLVQETLTQVERLVTITDSRDFLTHFIDVGEDLIDDFLDLEDVRGFFKNQRDIYDKAQSQINRFEKDRNYIDNDELTHIYNEMKTIIDMPQPYRKMNELDEWTGRFDAEYTEELENVAKPISEEIEHDQSDILKQLEELNGHDPYQKIYRKVKFQFSHMEQEVTSAGTVRDLKSAKDLSSTVKVSFFKEIEKAKNDIAKQLEDEQKKVSVQPEAKQKATDRPKQVEPSKPVAPIKKEKSAIINKADIHPTAYTELRSEDDINEYVNNLRDKLLAYLDDADIIKLL